MSLQKGPEELLDFLQSTVPANTPVMVSAEVEILRSLGVVSDERAVTVMRTSSLLIPPNTPATFSGLMHLLTELIKMNSAFTAEHQGALDAALREAAGVGDFQLTFGTFLPICRRLLEARKSSRPAGSP